MQTELRFIIYRQLIFPTTMIPMIPLSPLDDKVSDSDKSENEWTDEDSDDDSSFDSEFEEMMFGTSTREYITAEEAMADAAFDAEYASTREQYENLKRFPAILRTNKQIYYEASSLLYSEAVLVIEPGDIFCLRKKPIDLPFGTRNPCPWRHNPLKGVGKLAADGIVKYDTPEMDGHMEPHVFARFQKIYFSAVFDIEHTQHVEMWIDDDTHVIPQEAILAYQRVLNSSHLMKDFVKLLSRSPRITRLEICLEVEVMATSELLLEDTPFDIDDEEADARDEKADRLMDIANEKATELFLDSKICDPLLKLSNVQTFMFKFGFEMRDEDEIYNPPQKYNDLFQTWKTQIEGNFKEPRSGRGDSVYPKI
jgi:hypothetical protein